MGSWLLWVLSWVFIICFGGIGCWIVGIGMTSRSKSSESPLHLAIGFTCWAIAAAAGWYLAFPFRPASYNGWLALFWLVCAALSLFVSRRREKAEMAIDPQRLPNIESDGAEIPTYEGDTIHHGPETVRKPGDSGDRPLVH